MEKSTIFQNFQSLGVRLQRHYRVLWTINIQYCTLINNNMQRWVRGTLFCLFIQMLCLYIQHTFHPNLYCTIWRTTLSTLTYTAPYDSPHFPPKPILHHMTHLKRLSTIQSDPFLYKGMFYPQWYSENTLLHSNFPAIDFQFFNYEDIFYGYDLIKF